MNAALEVVNAFSQARDLSLASLNDSSFGDIHAGKTTNAFRNNFISGVEPFNKSAAKLLHFGKGVRFATLVGHKKCSTLFDFECVGLEVPAWIGRSSGCLCKQILERGSETQRCQRDILTEVISKGRIEGEWIAFVQGHNLCRG